jgi:SAM-dependent methyltransferase
MRLDTPGDRDYKRPWPRRWLALLRLKGSERVLDIGCGDGRITAEIAARVPQGSVIGVDSSHDMIAFASSHFGLELRPNVRFEVADAGSLPFREEFDLVVSFNARQADLRRGRCAFLFSMSPRCALRRFPFHSRTLSPNSETLSGSAFRRECEPTHWLRIAVLLTALPEPTRSGLHR